MAENAEEYVTKSELLEREIKLTERFDNKYTILDNEVKDIKEIILPLTESMKNIEVNTKRMADNYEKSDAKQDIIMDNQHKQDKRIEKLESATTLKGERIKVKGAVVGGVFSVLVALLGGLVAFGEKIAHLIFGN